MTCNHEICRTAFCPDCGEAFPYTVGDRLSLYLRERQDWEIGYEVQKDLSKWQTWVAAHIAADAGTCDNGGTAQDYIDLLADLNSTIEGCGLVVETTYGQIIQDLHDRLEECESSP